MERCREAGGDLEDRESRESVDYNAVYQRPYGHVGREVKATSASRAACLAESEGPGSEICPSAEPWTLPGTSFILLGETQPKVPAPGCATMGIFESVSPRVSSQVLPQDSDGQGYQVPRDERRKNGPEYSPIELPHQSTS